MSVVKLKNLNLNLNLNLLLLPLLLLFWSVLPTLAAQSDEDAVPAEADQDVFAYGGRYAGDLGLQVNAYLWAPLFNIDPNGEVVSPNLGLGGGLDLAVAYYLTPQLGLGGFLDLGITAPANQPDVQNYFLVVLLGARISYDFNIYTKRFQSHPLFSIPIGLGVAVSAAKYGDVTNVIPVVKLDAGFYINPFNEPEWAFGMSLHYWFAPEFSRTEFSRIGNYLMIGLGVIFHSGV